MGDPTFGSTSIASASGSFTFGFGKSATTFNNFTLTNSAAFIAWATIGGKKGVF